MPFPLHDQPVRRRWAARIGVAFLILALLAAAAFGLATQRSIVKESALSESNAEIAASYQNARFWVGQEESLERKYRLEPSTDVLHLHDEARHNVSAYLKAARAEDGSPSTRLFVSRLLRKNAEYAVATQKMFAAVRAHNQPLVVYYDHVVTDPVFTTLEEAVYGRAAAAADDALDSSDALESHESSALQAGIILLATVLVLVGGLLLVIRRQRRTQRETRAAELARLQELSITDPLTELRNHRAFQEDLAQELQRTSRKRTPLSLVMLDVDSLKAVNDTEGHQRGDELLRTFARAIAANPRGTDRAYRVGGDEFAVILHDAGEWEAFEFAQRLHASLAAIDGGRGVGASAGISQALGLRPKDDVIREADLALMNAKRFHQHVVVYTPEMKPFKEAASEADGDGNKRALASALALAVDAKDSYTRSHSQTVATLCALIATELGLEADSVERMRLAGLLHDVGKIGIPDSILKKPAALDEGEFELMKTHSTLGESIVVAAELAGEAKWIRHHHERVDGSGYPDGLSGEDVPLESRIIHVADAFEAMTSDRPYRAAPGQEFAVEELRRHAGTQFDRDVVDALVRVIGDPTVAEPLIALTPVSA